MRGTHCMCWGTPMDGESDKTYFCPNCMWEGEHEHLDGGLCPLCLAMVVEVPNGSGGNS